MLLHHHRQQQQRQRQQRSGVVVEAALAALQRRSDASRSVLLLLPKATAALNFYRRLCVASVGGRICPMGVVELECWSAADWAVRVLQDQTLAR